MNKKINCIIHLVIPLFVLHLIEEVMTRFYETDTLIQKVSVLLHQAPLVTYLLVEIALFIFLAVVLYTIIKKSTPQFLLGMLVVLCLYEFAYLFESIKTVTYASGLITGTMIGIAGLFLAQEVLF